MEDAQELRDFGSDEIAALFTRSGQYAFARWGRPVAPVIFGLSDESLAIFRSVIPAVFAHAGHPVAETDPEMGSNLMIFFLRDWAEIDGLSELEALIGQSGLGPRLAASNADQYRMFRFDADGGIRACVILLRMSGALAQMHPAALAEMVAVRSALDFAQDVRPSPALAALIRAAYEPVMPVAAADPAHALRLAARLAVMGAG